MSGRLNKYLYAIHALKEKYLCVRCVDVARFLKLSKPSVSTSVRQMQEKGLVLVEPDGNLALTSAGLEQAELLGERICFFEELLKEAGVDPSLARQDALAFGWDMSRDSFEAFQSIWKGR